MSRSKILLIGTLMLTIASVILAASLIVIQNSENSQNNASIKIETMVPDSTIKDIVGASEDGYVGASEKADLVAYLASSEKGNYSVAMVDSLVSSAYQKGTTYINTLTEGQKSTDDIKQLDAYLWALSESSDTGEVAELIKGYVAQAKKVNMLGTE